MGSFLLDLSISTSSSSSRPASGKATSESSSGKNRKLLRKTDTREKKRRARATLKSFLVEGHMLDIGINERCGALLLIAIHMIYED